MRQPEHCPGSSAGTIVQAEPSAVQLDDPPGERQPKANAAGPVTGKGMEETLTQFRRNSAAAVFHGDLKTFPSNLHINFQGL